MFHCAGGWTDGGVCWMDIQKLVTKVACGVKNWTCGRAGCKSSKSPSRDEFFVILIADLKISPS